MKFLVEINPKEGRDETTAAFLSGTLLSEDCYSKLKVDISVTEYKAPRQVEAVKTGVLSLPANVKYIVADMKSGCGLLLESFKLRSGDMVNLSTSPEFEPLCTDVKDEIDWSNVKVGDLVELGFGAVSYKYYGIVTQIKEKAIMLKSGGEGQFLKEHIKSIRIIEEG